MDEMTPTTDPAPEPENEIPNEVREFVKKWTAKIRRAEKHHEKAFKRMRADQKYAANTDNAQWNGAEGKYVANIVQRHIQQKVSSLYAKNPRVKATRADRLEYRVWDGRGDTLQQAIQTLTVDLTNAQAAEIIKDATEGYQRNQMLDKLGKTMEIVFHHAMRENNLKVHAKQLVRRVVTCGVGYIELMYQRAMERKPETIQKIQDITQRVAHLEALIAQAGKGEITPDTAELTELKNTLEAIQAEGPDLVVREGLVFDYPLATQIIIDPECTTLTEFVGANWVARKFMFRKSQVQEIFGVDLGSEFKGFVKAPSNLDQSSVDATYSDRGADAKEGDFAAVYKIWDKPSGTEFVICDGYSGYLKAPATPDIKVERFWPIYPVVFNEMENEHELFPKSDVNILRSPQDEYNRSRDGLREHRRANRPMYVHSAGQFEDGDKEKLATRVAHEVVGLQGLPPNTPVDNVLQAFKGATIDPAMYDTTPVFDDVQRTVGSNESQFAGVARGTATANSIAEGARVTSVESNIDDLDDVLTMLARDGSQVLLIEMDVETVERIAGPGAVWPEFSRKDIVEEIFLEIVAGSSGKPNRAQEAATFERMAPTLVQIPGITPEWLARKALQILDERIPFEDAIVAGTMSIVAQNAIASGVGGVGGPAQSGQPGTGDPATDPASQGAQGANNAPQAAETAPGPQAGFPVGPEV